MILGRVKRNPTGVAVRGRTGHNAGMPKRSSKKKESDTELPALPQAGEGLAVPVEDVPADGKNPAAVALGRLGGKKGGPARAAKLTKKRRSEIAKKAAEARWQRRSAEG